MFILVFVIFNLDSENFSSLRMVLVQGAPILSFLLYLVSTKVSSIQYIVCGLPGSPVTRFCVLLFL